MVVNFKKKIFCFTSAHENLMRVSFGEIKYILLLSVTLSVITLSAYSHSKVGSTNARSTNKVIKY